MPRRTAMSAKKKEIMNAAMRERAFECATELLKNHGWRKFTMDKLAEAMGVSKGTLYNYFVDKKDVVCFLRNCIIDDVKGLVDSDLDKKTDIREFLRKILDVTLEKMGEYHFIALAFLDMAMSQDRESFIKCSDDFLQEKLLASVLQRCMEEGTVRKGDPRMMAITLNGCIAAVELSYSLIYGYDLKEPHVRDQIVDWLLNGILV